MSDRTPKLKPITSSSCVCDACYRSNRKDAHRQYPPNAKGEFPPFFEISSRNGEERSYFCPDCLKKLIEDATQLLERAAQDCTMATPEPSSDAEMADHRYLVVVVTDTVIKKAAYANLEVAEAVANEYAGADADYPEYDGAAIYDQQEHKFIRICSLYPDTTAQVLIREFGEDSVDVIRVYAKPDEEHSYLMKYCYVIGPCEVTFSQNIDNGHIGDWSAYVSRLGKELDDFNIYIHEERSSSGSKGYPNDFRLSYPSIRMEAEEAKDLPAKMQRACDILAKIKNFFMTSSHHDLYIEKNGGKNDGEA